jgi:hypothetical protein
MASGGARTRSGPPPDPNALRRDRKDDAASWIKLPARRIGTSPAWPLTKPSLRELALWRREWKRAQAVMWEHNCQELEVALYVRTLVEAEFTLATPAMRTLVRQQMDALGLTVPGLQRNRWSIAKDEVKVKRAAKKTASKKAAASPSRKRLQVVSDATGK